MTYISPVDQTTDDPEMNVIEKNEDLRAERFDFSMFFVVGIVLLLVGFFRMLIYRELSLLNIGFVVVGFIFALGSQHWLKKRTVTTSEKKLVRTLEQNQFIQSADFGFTEQIHQNQAHKEYREEIDSQKPQAAAAKSEDKE